jgi:hypothetical protein
VDKATIAERTRAKLVEAIRAGDYDPDDRIAEIPTAKRYAEGSRTPTREAMKQLVAVGLLVKRRGRTYVASLAKDNVLDLVDAFLEIEAACLRLAARNMTKARRLQIVRMKRGLMGSDPPPMEKVLELRQFLRNDCGNRELAVIAHFIEAKIGPYRKLDPEADELDLRLARILANSLSLPDGRAPVGELRKRMRRMKEAIVANWAG